jgi:hypothetical protein
MAKSKENQAKAPAPALEEPKAPAQGEQPGVPEIAPEAPAPEESTVPGPGEQSGAADTTPEAPAPAPEEPKAIAQVSDPDPDPDPELKLYTLEELAEANRIPGWQSAALHKLMGWEPGKRVTENVYKAGLARLKNRRIGG